jgi:hypothetical protein
MQRTQARPDIQAHTLALRPLEVDRPPDKAGGGDTRWPPALHREQTIGKAQSRTLQETARVAWQGATQPLVCIHQARLTEALQSLTEPYKAKSGKVCKKIEIAFIS